MFSTNIFLFLLLILPCRIIADDSSSFKLQDITYPIASSDTDALQPVTDPDFSPETLLAESENNVVAGCQSPSPSGRTRRSRLRKRQTDSCSWHPFKSGAPPTTDGAGAPTVKIDPADVKKPDEDKTPEPIPFGAAKRPEVCGSAEETIPVCHYIPGSRGSSRWLSPILVLIPVRLCKCYFPPFLPSLIIGCFWWTDLWLPFTFFLLRRWAWRHLHGIRRNVVLLLYLPPTQRTIRQFLSCCKFEKEEKPPDGRSFLGGEMIEREIPQFWLLAFYYLGSPVLSNGRTAMYLYNGANDGPRRMISQGVGNKRFGWMRKKKLSWAL